MTRVVRRYHRNKRYMECVILLNCDKVVIEKSWICKIYISETLKSTCIAYMYILQF